MPRSDDDPAPDPPGGLDERVLATLHGLQGSIAFNGLRRVLRAHPESLSRSLRRLQREGRVERAEGGYRMLGEPSFDPRAPPVELRPIAQVDLPPGFSSETVLGRLSGRWFGSLRWVGLVARERGQLLAWARRDGSGYVLLGIDRGVLRVYVRRDRYGEDDEESEDSAYELLSHAVDALRHSGVGPVPSVRYFASDAPSDARFLDN